MTAPCGVPSSGSVNSIPSMTPALRYFLEKFQNPSVGDFPFDLFHESFVRYGVEVSLDVGIHHPSVSALEERHHSAKGVLASSARAKAIALCGKFPLEDGFEHIAQSRLHHSVPHSGNTQGAHLFRPRFRNPLASRRVWLIPVFLQFILKYLEVLLFFPSELLNRLPIDACRSVVLPDIIPGSPQIRHRVDLVHQAEPFPSSHPSFEGCQHAFGPDGWFHPRPSGADFFDLYIGISRNLRRFGFHRLNPHSSTVLLPFAPRELPRFVATTSALTPGERLTPSLGPLASVSVLSDFVAKGGQTLPVAFPHYLPTGRDPLTLARSP